MDLTLILAIINVIITIGICIYLIRKRKEVLYSSEDEIELLELPDPEPEEEIKKEILIPNISEISKKVFTPYNIEEKIKHHQINLAHYRSSLMDLDTEMEKGNEYNNKCLFTRISRRSLRRSLLDVYNELQILQENDILEENLDFLPGTGTAEWYEQNLKDYEWDLYHYQSCYNYLKSQDPKNPNLEDYKSMIQVTKEHIARIQKKMDLNIINQVRLLPFSQNDSIELITDKLTVAAENILDETVKIPAIKKQELLSLIKEVPAFVSRISKQEEKSPQNTPNIKESEYLMQTLDSLRN